MLYLLGILALATGILGLMRISRDAVDWPTYRGAYIVSTVGGVILLLVALYRTFLAVMGAE